MINGTNCYFLLAIKEVLPRANKQFNANKLDLDTATQRRARSANKGMQVRYQIGTDGQPGVYMNTPGIVSNLVEQGVLTQDASDGSYKGELYKLAFYSSQLNYPLFRDDKSDTPLAFEDWKRFVDLLLISTDGVASLSAEQAAAMVEVVPPSNGSVLIDVNH